MKKRKVTLISRTPSCTTLRNKFNGGTWESRKWCFGTVEFELNDAFARWLGYDDRDEFIGEYPFLQQQIERIGYVPKWVASMEKGFYFRSW
ncbi:hypothetical protein M2137_001259 [Parabacteroides sp. PFB2-10]|uniref:hypothetical protein n=1 Tax=Parabacteroides sp. PFB2-10 TaxID=1742405 RepID=UPI00247675CF|nr:hypothetical protein [Parabacteroides sp. PFB2-10]MDH6312488.1 hypothetical protein [Parabacteroides sp. PFB2-10]